MPAFLKVPFWGLGHFLTTERKSFKVDEKCYLFYVKSSFCSQDIYIFLLTFGYVEKRLVKNSMVNSRMYYATDCTKNNFNTYIVRYLKK